MLAQIKIVVAKQLESYNVKSIKVKTPLNKCLTEFDAFWRSSDGSHSISIVLIVVVWVPVIEIVVPSVITIVLSRTPSNANEFWCLPSIWYTYDLTNTSLKFVK